MKVAKCLAPVSNSNHLKVGLPMQLHLPQLLEDAAWQWASMGNVVARATALVARAALMPRGKLESVEVLNKGLTKTFNTFLFWLDGWEEEEVIY